MSNVWVTELWDSAEDHAASLKHPETQKLIAETLPLIAAAARRGPNLSVLGGKGAR